MDSLRARSRLILEALEAPNLERSTVSPLTLTELRRGSALVVSEQASSCVYCCDLRDAPSYLKDRKLTDEPLCRNALALGRLVYVSRVHYVGRAKREVHVRSPYLQPGLTLHDTKDNEHRAKCASASFGARMTDVNCIKYSWIKKRSPCAIFHKGNRPLKHMATLCGARRRLVM